MEDSDFKSVDIHVPGAPNNFKWGWQLRPNVSLECCPDPADRSMRARNEGTSLSRTPGLKIWTLGAVEILEPHGATGSHWTHWTLLVWTGFPSVKFVFHAALLLGHTDLCGLLFMDIPTAGEERPRRAASKLVSSF